MEIREATPQDWPTIYAFWTQIVEAGETYAYPPGASSDEARALWMEFPPGVTVVAVDGEQIVGSAKMGPNRPGRGAHIATGSFMVDPEAQGRGVGRALGEYVIDWARRDGYHAIQFNAVVETNAAAVHLWRSLGFEVLATVPEAFDSATRGLVGLHVMYQKL
ncbi:GNAT family N-acetyltransferase [Actinoplanes sp. N902-109]|uniref:GNAT family N-acetyltransferase n=1 Tax=Actinoplanes sp. (strain N902-109) TaxID=649831 RepID=UPI0003293D25|nr:GNAT family N-acetyltransferase [Actinoplanes sp. N902-109]AGL14859.1 acetyltransferase, GNAT family protein [Actinoplanes sp. N902-109]